ncbi:MAG: hypothetical protein NTW21_03025 [Verrucomicrobia bacterium]|nr:hypothetical protein [Verrucomicrobiota bacterium]
MKYPGTGSLDKAVCCFLAWGALAGAGVVPPASAAEQAAAFAAPATLAFWNAEYGRATEGERIEPGSKPWVLDEQSLLLKTDRDALDVQMRRTKALFANLKTQRGAPDLKAIEAQFAAIAGRAEAVRKAGDAGKIRELYLQLRDLTRKASFANPLLNFKDLLFMGYMGPGGDSHMVDQYVGWNAKAGGGLYVLRDFKTAPKLVDVLEKSVVENGRFKGKRLTGGAFLRPDLSFDGKRIAFAWNNIEDQAYHIFTVNADGSRLMQLTDGTVNRGKLGFTDSSHNDFDPCWLPGGRIVFLTDRRGGYGRCHGRPLLTYAMYSMKADGSDMIPISYHETNEWNPSVDRDGKIVFTRWDYIDRDDCIAHHLWTCFPDGRDPRAPHGNYPFPLTFEDKDMRDGRADRPNGEWNIRAIPNSKMYIATASGHHTHSFGELVMIDTRVPDDGKMSQVKGITTGQNQWPDRAGDYATAWPLSEDFYLCHYREDLILMDRFGNRELLCPKAALPARADRLIHPMPFAARPVPPVIPPATYQGERAGPKAPKATISIMNVNESDMPMPEGIKVKWLRVIQIIPQLTPHINEARMGYATESLARIPLGVVPVESDGSIHFKAPVEKLLYFQLLDGRGLAVRSMRSVTYVHPGEKLSCVGCHEWGGTAPTRQTKMPLAFQRGPSDIKAEVSDGAIPFNWHRLVKPVFEAKCTACHREKGKGPDMSYNSLQSYAFHYPFLTDSYSNGEITRSGSRSIPGKFGAMASKMMKYLDKTHYGVALTPEEFRRITLWLDCNSNEFGAYTKLDGQRKGEIVWPEIDVDPARPLGVE